LPGTTSELPPSIRYMMLGTQGVMLCLSLFGVATGFGIIYLRKWARISILIWGGLCVFFGVIGIPIAYLAMFSPSPNSPALPVEGMQSFRWILIVIYGVPFLIGIWWLILFNRKGVKAQFDGATGSANPGLAQKPRCPLPITVLAWLYLTSILNLLFLPFFPVHAPVFVFAMLLPDRLGLAVLILSCLAFSISGIGLLKLKPWSYSLTMALQVFWIASMAVSLLRRDYKSTMLSFMEQYGASLHLPGSQFSANPLTQHFGWFMVFGVLFACAILGMFVCYRKRFLEAAAAAAASASTA
jgi:hypothetical protein